MLVIMGDTFKTPAKFSDFLTPSPPPLSAFSRNLPYWLSLLRLLFAGLLPPSNVDVINGSSLIYLPLPSFLLFSHLMRHPEHRDHPAAKILMICLSPPDWEGVVVAAAAFSADADCSGTSSAPPPPFLPLLKNERVGGASARSLAPPSPTRRLTGRLSASFSSPVRRKFHCRFSQPKVNITHAFRVA